MTFFFFSFFSSFLSLSLSFPAAHPLSAAAFWCAPQNTRETVAAIKGMHLERAKQFLQNVIDKKEIVPFKRFLHGVGRKAQVRRVSSGSVGIICAGGLKRRRVGEGKAAVGCRCSSPLLFSLSLSL